MRAFLQTIGLALLLTGCGLLGFDSDDGLIRGTGTIHFIHLEGGHFVLDGDDGTRYEPMGLDESYRQDGLRVRYTVEPLKDVVSICQCGRIVEVVRIDVLDG